MKLKHTFLCLALLLLCITSSLGQLHFNSIDISLQGGYLIEPDGRLPYKGGEYGKIGVIFDKKDSYRGIELEFFYLTPDNFQLINNPPQSSFFITGDYRDHIGLELSGFWLFNIASHDRLQWQAGPIISMIYELEDYVPYALSTNYSEHITNVYNSLGLKTAFLFQFSKGVGLLLSSKLVLLDMGYHEYYIDDPNLFFSQSTEKQFKIDLLRELYYFTAGFTIRIK